MKEYSGFNKGINGYITLKIPLLVRSLKFRTFERGQYLHSVFVRSKAGIVGSNPTEGMDVCFYSVCVR
jgi:hypothetical protein